MKIIIQAGGKGKRLGNSTTLIPKPMIKINNKPLIEYSLDLFKAQGFTDFIFTLCYLPKVIKKHYTNGEKFGINISYFIEKTKDPLGTAGALAFLNYKITDTFIVCSGDIIRSCNIKDILNFHKNKKGLATICVYRNIEPIPKSIISFNETFQITKFIERPKKKQSDEVWSNASLYVFEPEIFSLIPKNKFSDFGMDIFPKLLKNNKKLFAYKDIGYFLDVGTKEKIKIAEKDIRNKNFKI